MRQTFLAFSTFVVTSLLSSPLVWAVVPAEKLVPMTTKGFVSVADMDRLTNDFNETQFGRLLADPVMKPFSDDLKRQLQQKWAKQYEPLGITWEDLSTVPTGEVAMARVLMGEKQSAAVVIADVTNNAKNTAAFLAKVDEKMKTKGANKTTDRHGDIDLTIYLRGMEDGKTQTSILFVHPLHQQLVVTDDLGVARGIIKRLGGDTKDSLAGVKAYQRVIEQSTKAQGDPVPHLKWFVDPFGYVDAVRAANPSQEKKKGRDMAEILRNEGFTAVEGIGGLVTLTEGPNDIMHRTMVYAPAVERASDDNPDKYDLAMRMLSFPNGDTHEPPNWIPRGLATFASLNADIINGFEHSKTLVNRIADDEIFEDVLESLKIDPAGPQVDVRKEIVANAGEHVMVLSNYQVPITTDSERLLVCISLTNVEPVRQALNKIMENDPNARKHTIGKDKMVVWEIVDEEVELPEFELELGFEETDEIAGDQAKDEKLPNSAAAVAHGHLIVGSHLDFLVKVLEEAENRNSLVGSVDYQIVQAALAKMGAESDAVRTFSRTDEEFRSTYELLRQGKMPEGKSMMAKMLNMILDDGDDETIREQQLDGSKLPEFQVVRRYLGPAGNYVRSLEDGWLASGCILSSEQLQVVLKSD